MLEEVPVLDCFVFLSNQIAPKWKNYRQPKIILFVTASLLNLKSSWLTRIWFRLGRVSNTSNNYHVSGIQYDQNSSSLLCPIEDGQTHERLAQWCVLQLCDRILRRFTFRNNEWPYEFSGFGTNFCSFTRYVCVSHRLFSRFATNSDNIEPLFVLICLKIFHFYLREFQCTFVMSLSGTKWHTIAESAHIWPALSDN